MPRPRPAVEAYGLPQEEWRPPKPSMLPTPALCQIPWASEEVSHEGVDAREDDSAYWTGATSKEVDGESDSTMKERGSGTSSAEQQSEFILKVLMGELATTLDAHNKNIAASVGSQLQEVKQEILRRLDGRDSQISTAAARCAQSAPLPEASKQHDDLAPACASEALGPNAVGRAKGRRESNRAEHNSDSAWTRPSWRRELSPQDLEAADEMCHRASAAFSSEQRAASLSERDPEKPEKPTRLQQIVQGTVFESISVIAIVTNAIFIGIQTQLAMEGSGEQEDGLLVLAVNVAFTLFFSVELALRLLAFGAQYFLDRSNWQWHLLDGFTVVVSMLECSLALAVRMGGKSGQVQGVTQLRILRMLRLARLLRGMKLARTLSSIRALRTLVNQILFTVKSMMWAIFLLVIIIYLFAVSFTQAANIYRLEEGWPSLELREHGNVRLYKYWSSLPRSMFTLFLSITGGVSWEEAAAPLREMGGVWVVVFLVYICFTQMAVLNVITGYFCQKAVEGATLDPELVAQKVLASKRMYINKIEEIFAKIDKDGSGFITLDEFEEHLEDNYTKAYLASLGIDASDVWTLFKLMDADRGHQIDLKEFRSGCLRLRGGAKSLDLAKLTYEHNYMATHLGKFIARADQTLAQLVTDTAKKCSVSDRPRPRRP